MTKPRFDTVIQAPNRLQICAFLSPLEEAEFQVLRDELDVSDSVLSQHLRLLNGLGSRHNVVGKQPADIDRIEHSLLAAILADDLDRSLFLKD